MQFSYVAYTPDDGVLTGRVDAPTELDARADLVNRSYRILKLGPAWKPPGLEDLFPSLFKVGAVEVVRFARQLATMLTSGVGLLRTIEMLETETGNRVLRRTLAQIHQSPDEGVSLSEAMAEHPKIFSSLFTSVVQVGEHTGRLGVALEQMADILESEHEAKQKAIQTMMYPVAIIGLSMVTLFVLITIALPPLLAVFEKMEADIPLMTRIAVGGATYVKDNILKIPIGMVGLVIVWSFARRSQKISLFMDRMRLKAPIIGGFTLSAELARFSRTTAMLLEAGISLSMALQLGQKGCGNLVIRQAFADAEESLLSGHSVSEAFKEHPVLPAMFVQLVTIGEESNSLPKTMADAAAGYQRQHEQRLNSLLGLMEPVSTVVVGGIVGFIALSMFLPIYSGLDAIE